MVDATVFVSAARAFSGLVDGLPPDGWDGPGLGQWDLRALTGHTGRALVTVSTYLRRPAAPLALTSPEAYYTATAAAANSDPGAVAERGRMAGAALGDDPAAAVRSLVVAAVADVNRADDPVIETIAGGMRLSDYLPTRVFELAVHSLDIAAATGAVYAPPDDVLRQALALAGRIAIVRGDGAVALRALTGRHGLPGDFSVV